MRLNVPLVLAVLALWFTAVTAVHSVLGWLRTHDAQIVEFGLPRTLWWSWRRYIPAALAFAAIAVVVVADPLHGMPG